MSSVRALAPRTTMVAGHYLFLLVSFFFLLFVLLPIESSAVFRAGATFSTLLSGWNLWVLPGLLRGTQSWGRRRTLPGSERWWDLL